MGVFSVLPHLFPHAVDSAKVPSYFEYRMAPTSWRQWLELPEPKCGISQSRASTMPRDCLCHQCLQQYRMDCWQNRRMVQSTIINRCLGSRCGVLALILRIATYYVQLMRRMASNQRMEHRTTLAFAYTARLMFIRTVITEIVSTVLERAKRAHCYECCTRNAVSAFAMGTCSKSQPMAFQLGLTTNQLLF